MSVETKACLLCLQSVDENSPYYSLTNNATLVQKLHTIGLEIGKHLELIEDPVLCNVCNDRLKNLATFKEALLENDLKIGEIEESDRLEYLKTLSENTADICRLCLTSPASEERLEISLLGHVTELLSQCNVSLKANISELNKVCDPCYQSVTSMKQIMSLSSKNANLIEELALKQGKVTSNQLLSTFPLQLGKQEDVLNITRTPNTYKKKEKSSYVDNLKDRPSTSKAEYLTSKATQRNSILQTVKEELTKLHTSIDASPVANISDITLNLDEKGLVEETVSECNATQELIDVLEGRLNDQPVTDYEAQQLIDVLEDGLSDDNNLTEVEPVETHVSQSVSNSDENSVIEVPVTRGRRRKGARAVRSNTAAGQNDEHFSESKAPNVLRKTRSRAARNANSNVSSVVSFEAKLVLSEPDDEASGDEENGGRQTQYKKKRGKIANANDKAEPPRKKTRKVAAASAGDDAGTSNGVLPKTDTSGGPDSAGSDDNSDKPSRNLQNRPVQVTIIKGKRKSNKAQLDKTWQALTGQDKPGGSGEDNSQGGAELFVVKRRGRPPLSADKKVPKPNRNEREWVHCDVCPYKTYSRNSFIQHQLIHNVMSTVEVLNCNVCAFTTSNAQLMEQHKTTHETPNLTYKCIFCDNMYKRKTSCMYHTLRHDDQDVASQFYCLVLTELASEEYFECYQCDYQNPEEAAMPDHVIDHTVEIVKNPIVAKFKCKKCPYRTKSEVMLARHNHLHEEKKKKMDKYVKAASEPIKEEPIDEDEEEEEEEELPLFKCTKCHYATRQKRSLANHIGLKHNRAVRPMIAGEAAMAKATAEGLPMYFCNECSYSSYRKMNMPRHMLVHRTKDTMEMFECPHCIFETKHRRSYTRHMEVKHGVVV